jgi:hypothetical protein
VHSGRVMVRCFTSAERYVVCFVKTGVGFADFPVPRFSRLWANAITFPGWTPMRNPFTQYSLKLVRSRSIMHNDLREIARLGMIARHHGLKYESSESSISPYDLGDYSSARRNHLERCHGTAWHVRLNLEVLGV